MHAWKFSLIFKKKTQSQHSSHSSNSSNSSHSSHSSSFERHYFFFASTRSTRRSVSRFSIMYNLLKIMWCWAMTRSRFSFVIWFEFAIVSRMLKKTRTTSETRFRCDSKKENEDRIRRRWKEKKKNRIRRRWKKKREIAFDDVVVVRSKTSWMTRNSNHYCVCERSRFRRRRRRLHIELISQNTKTNFLQIVSQITSSFFEVVMTIKTKTFEKTRHHHALTKNFRLRLARRAVEFRQSILREFQRRLFVDDSTSIDDSIVLDDHRSNAKKTKKCDRRSSRRYEIFSSLNVQFLFVLTYFNSQEIKSLTSFFFESFITITCSWSIATKIITFVNDFVAVALFVASLVTFFAFVVAFVTISCQSSSQMIRIKRISKRE